MSPPTPPVCPSCKAPLKQNEEQCPLCGLILAKWKDPAQRAAEARLAEMAKSGQGLPAFVYLILIAIVALPPVLIFIPQAGVPILGAKIRYRPKAGENFRHDALSLYKISANGRIVEYLQTGLRVSHAVRERDTGGNITYHKKFEKLDIKPLFPEEATVEKPGESLWQVDSVMNPRGNAIDTLAGASAQIQSTTQNIQRLNKMRDRQHANERGSWPAEPGVFEESAPPVYLAVINQLDLSHLAFLDAAMSFQWPDQRVKRGALWRQDLTAMTPANSMSLSWRGNIEYRVTNFENGPRGYAVIVEWDSPVTVTASNQGGRSYQGVYKGRSVVNYADGVTDRLESELSVKIHSMSGEQLDAQVSNAVTRL